MSPDDLVERINRWEQRQGRLEADMADVKAKYAVLDRDVSNIKDIVHALTPLTTQTAVLVQSVSELDRDVGAIRDEFRTKVDRLQTGLENDRALRITAEIERQRERKSETRWLVTTVIAGFAMVVPALGLLLSLTGNL